MIPLLAWRESYLKWNLFYGWNPYDQTGLKHVEKIKCTDEIAHLRYERNSKSTIIKVLLENLSILTNATYKHSQSCCWELW